MAEITAEKNRDRLAVPQTPTTARGEPEGPLDGKKDILGMYLPELKEYLAGIGEKPFRAKQIYEWLHVKGVRSFDGMTSISKALREKLAADCAIPHLTAEEVLTSAIDGTQKYLFALPDGNIIESVRMVYSYGSSVCISSQVGCRMGCRFCASTIGGVVRSLTASEMLSQVTEIEKLSGTRVSHVVIMGSGEPLDNYDNLVRFLRLVCDPDGEALSARSVTVSTCGIVPNIYALADEGIPVTLALSLHASSQEEREKLLPIAKKYELSDVLDAMRYYFDKTGRRITFEYSCVEGVNTSAEDARKLSELLRGMNCHINLIPVNPVKERDFTAPDRRSILAFKNSLEKLGLHVTIRREMGRDISGACGQLRRSFLDNYSAGIEN